MSSGKYTKKKSVGTKSLPIGILDYVRAQAEYYYVDKTLMIDDEYDEFFGFTYSEVKSMLEYYSVTDKEAELKDWYDG